MKTKFLEIKLSIKYKNKFHFINRQIPDIQIIEAKFPIDIITHNLNEVVSRMIETLKEEAA